MVYLTEPSSCAQAKYCRRACQIRSAVATIRPGAWTSYSDNPGPAIGRGRWPVVCHYQDVHRHYMKR